MFLLYSGDQSWTLLETFFATATPSSSTSSSPSSSSLIKYNLDKHVQIISIKSTAADLYG